MKLLLFLLFFVLFSSILAQSAQKTATEMIFSGQKLDSLHNIYGKNKLILEAYELQILTALSYYPELKEAHINFVSKATKLPYASHPTYKTLFNPFASKKYTIVISSKSTEIREPTLLHNLNFEEQIGAIGHELAHTSYYSKTSKFKILLDGIRYKNQHFKEKFEKMTDRIAIEHGLGTYLYAWCKAVYPIKMKDGKRAKTYYSPEEIMALIRNQTIKIDN